MEHRTFDRRTDKAQDLTVITVTGAVSSESIIAALDDFYESGATSRLLWDFSAVHGGGITEGGLHRIIESARRQAHRRTGGKTAIVASSDAQFGVGRMYEILSELAGHPIAHAVFRSTAEAVAWLNAADEGASGAQGP